MQPQQQSNWCWAGVSTSVAGYYDPATTWTQCTVANDQTHRTDCCTAPGATGPCNIYGFLDSALTTVGHFAGQRFGTASFAEVSREIDEGRPVGVRTAWQGGGAHFLAIVAHLPANVYGVDDPIYGKSDVAEVTFQTAYQGTGAWTNTYFTK
jgi:hypothetical protein